MLKKRAQGLSITTIVVAVIALIVIVVIISILTGKISIFSSGLEKISASRDKFCNDPDIGGNLKARSDCTGSGKSVVISKDSLGKSEVCCVESK